MLILLGIIGTYAFDSLAEIISVPLFTLFGYLVLVLIVSLDIGFLFLSI